MTTRTSAACAIRVCDEYDDGTDRVWFVGPFMPHAGSAVCRALFDLESGERPPSVRLRDLSVVTLFIGPGESDLGGLM